MLLGLLKTKAVELGHMQPEERITAERAFLLVRDMPYVRGSSRQPESTIREWRGTCSGKHYLLKALFAELGYKSKLIACTTEIHIDPKDVPRKLRKLLEESGGRFVDVHNYLILDLTEGEMVVDATWPVSTAGMGTTVNERFVLGESQMIACEPLKTWVVPDDQDPQAFKDQILRQNFSAAELEHREAFIKALGRLTNSRWVKLRLQLRRLRHAWSRACRRSST